MSSAARAIGFQIPRGRDLPTMVAAGAFAFVAGALAVRSTQVSVTLTLLVLLLAVRARSRIGGLTLLWTYWLLAPFVRRILDLSVSAPSADPLSVLPFLATAILALIELRENRLDRRARSVLAIAGIGILIGVPTGLAADPTSAAFAVVAYMSSLSAFVLGWGDGVRRVDSLQRTLVIALLPIALYGIAQYFFPLTAWDSNWVNTSDLSSLGAPQEGHIRIFSTLNAPFTLAIVLGVGIMLGLGVRRRLGLTLLITLPLVVALALTFVRSAWLGLVVGLIVFAIAARGRASGRVVVVVAVCLVGLVVIGSSNPTTQAFTERITSLGNPGEDVSARERLATTERLLPTSLSQPLGAGLGQAGLAARLEGSGESEQLTVVDDGYLSLLRQSGPFGLLFVLAALMTSVTAAVRGLGRSSAEGRQAAGAVFATLVMLLVCLASGDVFFGMTGAILWYLCGVAMASGSREERVVERIRASG